MELDVEHVKRLQGEEQAKHGAYLPHHHLSDDMRWDGLKLADVTDKDRQEMGKSGVALPDGSYPIPDKTFLGKAIQAFGRAKDKAAAKSHIIKRARALGASSMLPSGWVDGVSASDDVHHEGGDSMAVETARTGAEDARLKLQLSETVEIVKQQNDEIARLRADAHRRSVDETVAGWSNTALKNTPGFLAEARKYMLADDGGEALVLNLSEDEGGTKTLTASDIVRGLVGSLIGEDGKVQLSEQAYSPGDEQAEATRPPDKIELAEQDNSPEAVQKRADEVRKEFGLERGIPTTGEEA
jgi:hypothetical protein